MDFEWARTEDNQAFDAPRRWWPFGPHEIATELHLRNLLCVLDTRNLDVAPTILRTGWWEPSNDLLVRSILNVGDTYVGGGACFGYFTLLAGNQVTERGRVVAFEANPWLLELCARSVHVTGMDSRTRLYARAVVPSGGGVLSLSFCPEMAGGGCEDKGEPHPEPMGVLTIRDALWRFGIDSFLTPDGCFEGERSKKWAKAIHYQQQAVTLDDLVPDGPVRLIHLDVEHMSLAVVLGAEKVIARSPHLHLLVEWHRSHADEHPGILGKAKKAWSLLKDCGFTPCAVRDPGGRKGFDPPTLVEASSWADMMALPPGDVLWSRRG